MSLSKRLFWVVALLVLWGWSLAGAVRIPLALPEVENRMVRGGYLDTLNAAYWAAAQGEAVVPLLAQLLDNRAKYAKELGGATGAFPFNALWALGRIPKSVSRQVLEKYYFATKDPMAALALQGWKLRDREQNPRYGVLAKDAALLESAEEQARVLKRLKAGQQVKVLHEKNPNPREVGPRGGPVYYDRVDLVPSGEQGYIIRAGDDFTPFM
jgi:hypothetical protein